MQSVCKLNHGPLQNTFFRYLNYANERVQKLGIPPQTCSFSAGVFVADVRKWKENDITDKLEYWLELNTRYDVFLFCGLTL